MRVQSCRASAAMLGLALGLAPACLAPPPAHAQLEPGGFYVMPQFGPVLALNELLRKPAIYPTNRPSDPENNVVTDIKNDAALLLGTRFAYGLTRRLAAELEVNWSIGVCVIRQLEIMPDAEPGDQPQYETTTFDVDTFTYGLNLSYYFPVIRRIEPVFSTGFGEHVMNLRRKGAVDPDPVRDRYIMAGLGFAIRATDRLTIRADVRDFMYNFRFDNQFVDPEQSRLILFRREEFIRTTEPAGDKFQNDLFVTVSFAVQTF